MVFMIPTGNHYGYRSKRNNCCGSGSSVLQTWPSAWLASTLNCLSCWWWKVSQSHRSLSACSGTVFLNVLLVINALLVNYWLVCWEFCFSITSQNESLLSAGFTMATLSVSSLVLSVTVATASVVASMQTLLMLASSLCSLPRMERRWVCFGTGFSAAVCLCALRVSLRSQSFITYTFDACILLTIRIFAIDKVYHTSASNKWTSV